MFIRGTSKLLKSKMDGFSMAVHLGSGKKAERYASPSLIRRFSSFRRLDQTQENIFFRFIGYRPDRNIISPLLHITNYEEVAYAFRRNVRHVGDQIKFVAPDQPWGTHAYGMAVRLEDNPELAEMLRGCPALWPIIWGATFVAGGAQVRYSQLTLLSMDRLLRNPTNAQLMLELCKTFEADAELTLSRDPVRMSGFNFRWVGNYLLIEFRAQTRYGHALSGTVLHVIMVGPNGSIRLGWFGAGGTGPVSYFFNNFLAMGYALGTWPGMIRNFHTLSTVLAIGQAPTRPMHLAVLTDTMSDLVVQRVPAYRYILERLFVMVGGCLRLLSSSLGERNQVKRRHGQSDDGDSSNKD